MKLRLLKRNEIDDQRWDERIESAPQGLPYAFSWYLDVVADRRWGALVSEDYQQVMPLPWNRKLLGMRQVYAPFLVQQLGVMGSEVSSEMVQDFLQQIPLAYRRVVLRLNERNEIEGAPGYHLQPRTNLLLDLRSGYEMLWNGYDKSLRRRLRKAKNRLRVTPSEDAAAVARLYHSQLEKRLNLGDAFYTRAEHLMSTALKKQKGIILQVSSETELLATGFFLHSHGRLINLFGASTEEGRRLHAMHRMLDYLIESHAGQPMWLDFEGSEVPSITSFFRSFGAERRTYSIAQRDLLPGWWRLLEKRVIR